MTSLTLLDLSIDKPECPGTKLMGKHCRNNIHVVQNSYSGSGRFSCGREQENISSRVSMTASEDSTVPLRP
jgi:hypothetical protein